MSLPVLANAGAAVSSKATAPMAPVDAIDWKDNTISPVINPMYMEDPVIRSEIRPIFAYHNISNDFVTQGGNAQLYALQLRWAITDRLAFIATQDGYFNIDTGLGVQWDGWMDIAAGFKYAVIDSQEHQFILTPGFTFSIPLGSEEVFQGKGDGEFDFFVSAMKGFGNAHLMGNVGLRTPISGAQSTSLHYSLMADYWVSPWFIPFVAANGWTVLSEGSSIPLDSEGYDVINFGSSRAGGVTQMTVGGGFRSRILSNVFFGAGYEIAVISPEGLTDDRFTFDLSIRF
ncbi:MAG: hypothetical protein KDK99_12840 [Verrucomicrobiales bacterium]|nr:hypothetical protein [Verrucomicrobiales bacterium]